MIVPKRINFFPLLTIRSHIITYFRCQVDRVCRNLSCFSTVRQLLRRLQSHHAILVLLSGANIAHLITIAEITLPRSRSIFRIPRGRYLSLNILRPVMHLLPSFHLPILVIILFQKEGKLPRLFRIRHYLTHICFDHVKLSMLCFCHSVVLVVVERADRRFLIRGIEILLLQLLYFELTYHVSILASHAP
jgi:hypothetical protein